MTPDQLMGITAAMGVGAIAAAVAIFYKFTDWLDQRAEQRAEKASHASALQVHYDGTILIGGQFTNAGGASMDAANDYSMSFVSTPVDPAPSIYDPDPHLAEYRKAEPLYYDRSITNRLIDGPPPELLVERRRLTFPSGTLGVVDAPQATTTLKCDYCGVAGCYAMPQQAGDKELILRCAACGGPLPMPQAAAADDRTEMQRVADETLGAMLIPNRIDPGEWDDAMREIGQGVGEWIELSRNSVGQVTEIHREWRPTTPRPPAPAYGETIR